MEHCYCYDFTRQSYHFTKPSCKFFRINIKDFIDFDNFRIRSVIDPYSAEFKLSLEEFEECEDIKTDKAWFKLMHLLFGFLRDCDVKKKIVENVKLKSRDYSNYEANAKRALSEYIELLRTGDYIPLGVHKDFYKKMSVEDLVDLLEEELRLRTTIYQNQNSKKVVIVEITDYYYDYDALYKKYGITPEDNSSESYNNFIKYITTSEETKRLKNQQAMFAQMWGVD
jgi:hypothetical protein